MLSSDFHYKWLKSLFVEFRKSCVTSDESKFKNFMARETYKTKAFYSIVGFLSTYQEKHVNNYSAVVGFLHRDYRFKSVATEIPRDAGRGDGVTDLTAGITSTCPQTTVKDHPVV